MDKKKRKKYPPKKLGASDKMVSDDKVHFPPLFINKHKHAYTPNIHEGEQCCMNEEKRMEK